MSLVVVVLMGPALAPVNPDFELALQRRMDGFTFGAFPVPLDLSHLRTGRPSDRVGARQYPSRYDLRDIPDKLPPVRNQGYCNSCWAFATFGSLESFLRPGEIWDFSENNLNNLHGLDLEPCYGGTHLMSTAYLTRWDGPILESDDPYQNNESPSDLPEQKHVQQVVITMAPDDPTANDYIKHLVTTYGGLYLAYYHSFGDYNDNTHAHYYSGFERVNHAVTIVGWDDNFSRNDFNNTAPGDGAYIIRNSWDVDFGEGGYFYISYYDTSLESIAAFNNAEPVSEHDRIYQYDPLGWTASVGSGGIEETKAGQSPEVYWGANIFQADGDDLLLAVSFYTASFDSSYRIFVYREVGVHPGEGTLGGSAAGSFEYPGYHTVAIDDPGGPFSEGERFSVAVEFTTPGYHYPVPVEYPVAGYSSGATGSVGESFVRASEADAWTDIQDVYTDTNVCIKAFAQGGCDDGNACTEDIFNGSECEYIPLDCDDQNPCTEDSCDPSTGCTHTNNQSPCDDGDACTLTDTCQDGSCLGSDPVTCTPLDDCHLAGECQPDTGLCTNPPADDGAPCDDQDACTLDDACQDAACLGGDALVCTSLDDCHQAGVCDPDSGECSNPSGPNGTACDDQDPCTLNDACLAGACLGDALTCLPLDDCHLAGECDPATGECSNPEAPDQTPCPGGSCLDGECREEPSGDNGGCGCATGRTPAGPLGLLLVFLALIRRIAGGWRDIRRRCPDSDRGPARP